MSDFEIDKWIRDSFCADDANEYLYYSYLNSPSNKSDVRRGFKRFTAATGIKRKGYSGAILFPCVAIALASVICLLVLSLSPEQPEAEWLSFSTAAGQTKELLLCDGTILQVGPCSNIVYPDFFDGDTRKIFATGDVFADVAKDEEKMFVVSSNGMDIKVHGTAFHLYSYPDNAEQEVSLARGSVSVSVCDGHKEIAMSPGETLIYDKSRDKFICKTFNVSSFENQKSGAQILFDNENLETIARKLSSRFGARVLVCDKSLFGQQYYASFVNGEGLAEILEILGRQGGFSVKYTGDEYILMK